MKRRLIGLCGLALLCSPAVAQSGDAPAQVRRALEGWADDFNQGRADKLCDLFAPGLVATIRGDGDRGRDALCANLTAALSKPGRALHYAVRIHDIEAEGDLAAVRLDWTLTVKAGDKTMVSVERGLDVFRRQPDGHWRIVRFIVFSDDG
ncbi:MAG: hypothetical protein BGP06_03040 [Rhizobiales bacterium 65-9]|nr:nuclear transport factor 2 family protein [Hyphomicrobiales bacterium]OJY35836.1 MAG: hypothetical protein BGP06_03040 [Rhizobiales bacterium 65-9]